MPASKNDVMAASSVIPSRPLIEGPAVWTGADMHKREAEWTYRLSPAEVAELETAVRVVQVRGLDIADVRREDFPLPTLGPALERLRAEVLDGRGFVLLRGIPVEDGRPPTARRPTGASARISAAFDHRMPKDTCSVMSTTWGRASARRTPICAVMQPLNARIFTSIAAMWSHYCACGRQSREGFRRSSARCACTI